MFKLNHVLATAAALSSPPRARRPNRPRVWRKYVQACASCHGIAGQGNGPLAEFMTVDRAGPDPHRTGK
jgi:mono/diheme cytochrome c family protein